MDTLSLYGTHTILFEYKDVPLIYSTALLRVLKKEGSFTNIIILVIECGIKELN